MPDNPHPHPAGFGNETIQPVLIALVKLMRAHLTSLGRRSISADVTNLNYSTTRFCRSPRQ
jgi:hypothetical protein